MKIDNHSRLSTGYRFLSILRNSPDSTATTPANNILRMPIDQNNSVESVSDINASTMNASIPSRIGDTDLLQA